MATLNFFSVGFSFLGRTKRLLLYKFQFLAYFNFTVGGERLGVRRREYSCKNLHILLYSTYVVVSIREEIEGFKIGC